LGVRVQGDRESLMNRSTSWQATSNGGTTGLASPLLADRHRLDGRSQPDAPARGHPFPRLRFGLRPLPCGGHGSTGRPGGRLFVSFTPPGSRRRGLATNARRGGHGFFWLLRSCPGGWADSLQTSSTLPTSVSFWVTFRRRVLPRRERGSARRTAGERGVGTKQPVGRHEVSQGSLPGRDGRWQGPNGRRRRAVTTPAMSGMSTLPACHAQGVVLTGPHLSCLAGLSLSWASDPLWRSSLRLKVLRRLTCLCPKRVKSQRRTRTACSHSLSASLLPG
jgi:hypothetical protein